jgi:CheY-like chemotaxis protein
MRVLVIDDDPHVTKFFRLLLGRWGHEVFTANDGASALQAAPGFLPDVALVDLSMPRMSGYELARRLRELPGLGGLRLFALTGLPAARGLDSCFERYLLKPVAPDELKRLLAKLRPRLRGSPSPTG